MYWNEEWNMKYGNGKQGHWKQHLGAICVQMAVKFSGPTWVHRKHKPHTPRFYLAAVEKNREKAWDQN